MPRNSLAVALLALVSWGLPFRDLAPSDPAISRTDFARLMTDLSEPEGYFDTDNFISNEAAYLRVLPPLRRLGVRGGVYVGVGPDQNYSYIAQLEPRLAIIVDIRRQNALEHLYFKALFELSHNRVEYLERLFGRPLGGGPATPERAPIRSILEAADRASRDPAFSARKISEALAAIRAWRLPLEEGDLHTIEYIARAFSTAGPDLKFTSFNREPRPHHPTYRQLLEETDGAGLQCSYLAQEDRFRIVKRLHGENRILPLVGDFAGAHAFSAVGRELRRRGLELTCFYASNVEFYLFRGDRWPAYLRNLQALPRARSAYVIRTYANSWQSHPAQIPGYYMTTVLQPLEGLFASGADASYWDLVTRGCILR